MIKAPWFQTKEGEVVKASSIQFFPDGTLCSVTSQGRRISFCDLEKIVDEPPQEFGAANVKKQQLQSEEGSQEGLATSGGQA